MPAIESEAALAAVVFGGGPRATLLAGRTARSAREAGCAVRDVTHRPHAELAEILVEAATPIWLVRAGAWLAANRPIVVPPPSASGLPLCAIGWPVEALTADTAEDDAVPNTEATINDTDGLRRPSYDAGSPLSEFDPAVWRRLYQEFGGDFKEAAAARFPFPPQLSVLMEPSLANAVARRMQEGMHLDEAIATELHAGTYRIVRYAALDVHYDERLRIAQVVTSLQRGGAERVTIDLARALNQRGSHCRIITVGSPTRAPFPAPPGTCDLAQLPRDRPARVAAAVRTAIADGADVVHAHLLDRDDLSQIAAAELPVVATVHNTRPGWQAGQAELRIGECDLLAACAQAVETELAATGQPIPLRTVWNGIDTEDISRKSRDPEMRRRVRREQGIGEHDFVLLTLANPRPQKRFPLLPAIVAALRDKLRREGNRVAVRLLLAGEAAQVHPAARQTVEETNAAILRHGVSDAVTWLGAVDDVSGVLAAADVLISASEHEGLSLAYVEALAAGLPVVATDAGGTRELAAEGVPLRIVPIDAAPDAFAAAIAEFVARRDRPVADLKDFSLDRMAERYAWLYPRVIATGRRCRKESLQPVGLWLITNNFSTGGAQSSSRRLLTSLSRSGVRVHAAVLQEDPNNLTPGLQSLRAAGVRVEVIPPPGTVDAAEAAARLLQRIDADPPRSVLLWNVIPEYKMLLADGLLDIPVFDVSPGEMYFASLERYFSRPRPGLPYRTPADYGRRLRGVIVKYQSEKTAAESLGAQVHVIPNGVPVADRPARPATNGRLVIGTAARISPQKRLEDLIEAVSLAHTRLPPYTFRIAGAAETGSEEYAEQLRKRAHDLPVEWLGDIGDVGRFLGGLDLFAQVSEPAGCPNASLEALAAGLAIVATDVGGASEQVIDGITGRLVARRDPGALADALVELAGNPSLRERFATAGHDHVKQHFSLDRMVADYRRVCLDEL
ncbi:MAG: glycosyltransferase [Planctomycetia bacterium]|nr:glycosyltransferase [Planctomycetia bacterium]